MNLLLRNYLHYNLYDQVGMLAFVDIRIFKLGGRAKWTFYSPLYFVYEMPLPALLFCIQADKLVSKSTFPASANNNEMARHLYYLGR